VEGQNFRGVSLLQRILRCLNCDLVQTLQACRKRKNLDLFLNFFEIRSLTRVMGVRNLVIFDFWSYLRQHCDVTVSHKNTSNTAICRSIQCLQVPERRLRRISYRCAGMRSRVWTPINFRDFRHIQKSLKNQPLQISTFRLKYIEGICHISRTFCDFLDNVCRFS